MAQVIDIVNGIVDRVKDTTDNNVIMVGLMPTTFRIGTTYVLFPEEVEIEDCIQNGSFQEFDVGIVTPIRQIESSRIDTLNQSVSLACNNVNILLATTFSRLKQINGGNVYGCNYKVSLWETDGYVMAMSEVTLHMKAFINY